MKFKEAIEFIKNEIDYMDYVAFKKEAPFEAGIFQQKKDNVISLLKQGKAYKKIVKAIEKEGQIYNCNTEDKAMPLWRELDLLKLKYLPKEAWSATRDDDSA